MDRIRRCCSLWATLVSSTPCCYPGLLDDRGLVPACLLSAMQMESNKFGMTNEAKNAVVRTQVHLGKPKDTEGYALEVELQVEGVPQELIDAGHKVRTSPIP